MYIHRINWVFHLMLGGNTMKKTWTTKVLIALMTLAMVVGVFIVAPKEAKANVTVKSSGGSLTQTVTVGGSITEFSVYVDPVAGFTNPTYLWEVMPSGDGLPTGVKLRNATNAMCPVNGVVDLAAPAKTYTCQLKVTITDGDGTGTEYGYSDNISIKVNPADSPLNVSATNPTDVKVGSNLSIPFTVTGFPMPDNMTVTGTGSDLTYTYSKTAGTVTVTGKPAAIATGREITVSGSNGVQGGTPSKTVTFDVAKGDAPDITLSAPSSAPKGSNIDMTVSGAPESGTYSWYKGTTATGSPVATGSSYSYPVPSNTSDSSVSFVVKWVGTNYEDGTSDAKTINFVNPKQSVTIEPPQSGSYAVGSTIYLRGSAPGAEPASILWTQSGGAGTISNPTNLTGASYVVNSNDLGNTITFTLKASGTTTSENTATANVTIYSNDYVTSPTTSSMTFQTATLYDVQTFNATTFYGGQMKISNSNPAIATVTAGGVEVGSGGMTIANNTQVQVKAKAYGRTYVDIVPVNGNNNNGKRVTVYVGSATPTLDVQFWSSDNCTTTLTKLYNWGTLKVTVDNYNPQYPYVTITRANIRTYVQGGSYYSHPSTYTYTAALTQDLSDPLKATATLYVIPQYNGSTYYTAAYTGAVSKNSPTIYVTGYTTLPQTGPNYTWAYVLGGLCLASVATAVTLNVRKKKRESI